MQLRDRDYYNEEGGSNSTQTLDHVESCAHTLAHLVEVVAAGAITPRIEVPTYVLHCMAAVLQPCLGQVPISIVPEQYPARATLQHGRNVADCL